MSYQVGPYTIFDDNDEPVIRAWWNTYRPHTRKLKIERQLTPVEKEHRWTPSDYTLSYDKLSASASADVWQLYANLHQERDR